MDEAIKAVIQKYESQLAPILEEMAPLVIKANKIKDRINGLYELEGESIPYPEASAALAPAAVQSDQSSKTFPITRKDQFYGKPLATVVREILEWRGSRDMGAIPLDELFDLMKQGGYGFEGKDDSTKKRILASAIGKNTIAFARVPNTGDIGLAEWYGIKRKRPTATQVVTELLDGTEVKQNADDFLNTQQFPLNQAESLPEANPETVKIRS